jgi:hypothetical protein
VDDAPVVGRLHRPGHLLDQPRRLRRGQRRAAQPVGQRAARAELQGEVGHVAVGAEVVDLDDAAVADGGDGLRLGQEAQALVAAGVPALEDHLQGHLAVELPLAGAVDDAHAAPPQLPEDLVAVRSGREACRGRGR